MVWDDPVVIIPIIGIAIFLLGANKIPQLAKGFGQARLEFERASKRLPQKDMFLSMVVLAILTLSAASSNSFRSTVASSSANQTAEHASVTQPSFISSLYHKPAQFSVAYDCADNTGTPHGISGILPGGTIYYYINFGSQTNYKEGIAAVHDAVSLWDDEMQITNDINLAQTSYESSANIIFETNSVSNFYGMVHANTPCTTSGYVQSPDYIYYNLYWVTYLCDTEPSGYQVASASFVNCVGDMSAGLGNALGLANICANSGYDLLAIKCHSTWSWLLGPATNIAIMPTFYDIVGLENLYPYGASPFTAGADSYSTYGTGATASAADNENCDNKCTFVPDWTNNVPNTGAGYYSEFHTTAAFLPTDSASDGAVMFAVDSSYLSEPYRFGLVLSDGGGITDQRYRAADLEADYQSAIFCESNTSHSGENCWNLATGSAVVSNEFYDEVGWINANTWLPYSTFLLQLEYVILGEPFCGTTSGTININHCWLSADNDINSQNGYYQYYGWAYDVYAGVWSDGGSGQTPESITYQFVYQLNSQ